MVVVAGLPSRDNLLCGNDEGRPHAMRQLQNRMETKRHNKYNL